MSSFLLDTLLDEDTSEELAQRLRDQGHDVERVVNIEELGDGVDDSDVHNYAEKHDRVIITHDEGFFNRCMNSAGAFRLLWITDQQAFEPYEKAEMVENAVEIIEEYDIMENPPRAIALTAQFLEQY